MLMLAKDSNKTWIFNIFSDGSLALKTFKLEFSLLIEKETQHKQVKKKKEATEKESKEDVERQLTVERQDIIAFKYLNLLSEIYNTVNI